MRDDDSNQETLLSYSKLDTADEPRHHRDPAVILLAQASIVASVVTFTVGLSTLGGFCEGNENEAYHRLRFNVLFFCNATSFVSSLAIHMLLLDRKHLARAIQSNALSAFMFLNLIGLAGAIAAVSCRKVSTFVCVSILVLSVLDCIKLQVLARVGSGSHAEDDASGRMKGSPGEAIWRVASGAAHHMTGNQSLLLTGGGYLPVHHGSDGEGVVVHRVVDGGEEVPLRVRGSGSVRTERVALDDVWYVPGLDSNLVSTGQLARQGCDVTLGPGGCRITRAGALVGSARLTEAWHFQLDFLKLAGSE